MNQGSGENSLSRAELVENILAALNRYRMRATYSAVAAVVGISAQTVGSFLGPNRPYASWVVSRGTKSPSGYTVDQYHPELYLNAAVIDSATDLEALLAKMPD